MYEYHSLHVLSTTVDLRLSAVSLPPPLRYMEGLGVGGDIRLLDLPQRAGDRQPGTDTNILHLNNSNLNIF